MSLLTRRTAAILVLSAASLAAQAPEPAHIAAAANGLTLRSIGPAIMGGRIADVEVHPNDRSTWYVAVGSGGASVGGGGSVAPSAGAGSVAIGVAGKGSVVTRGTPPPAAAVCVAIFPSSL